jgi:GT2 family glycosyltransferase
MKISVVIPTCNRRARLLSLLTDLSRSVHPIREVIVVDSSDEKLAPADLATFPTLSLRYLTAEKSVCAQRNRGIREAEGNWIFLCDDDIEVPPDYLGKLAAQVDRIPAAGAISGLILELENGHWRGQSPVTSTRSLLWRHLFQLGFWGEISAHGLVADRLAARYRRRGNHLSRAGWPVITDFSAPFFRTPVFTLGASLVRRDWLLASPFDERLDAHGFGDNYGVAIGFPAEQFHVLPGASVRHHREAANRLAVEVAYGRRILALHYFISTRPELADVSPTLLLWSLMGQMLFHGVKHNGPMFRAALTSFKTIVFRRNPLLPASVHLR